MRLLLFFGCEATESLSCATGWWEFGPLSVPSLRVRFSCLSLSLSLSLPDAASRQSALALLARIGGEAKRALTQVHSPCTLMCLCLCLYLCMYVRVLLSRGLCMSLCVSVCLPVSECVHEYVHVCVCVTASVSVSVPVSECVSVFARLCIPVCLPVNAWIYMCALGHPLFWGPPSTGHRNRDGGIGGP